MEKTPSYDGSGLANLISEIELRLGGDPVSPGLERPDALPDAETYVVVLFDGLGIAQLDHPGAAAFRASKTATLEAPFPSTTSVSLAGIATGMHPARHGQVAHLAWFPDLGRVVNTLKWVTPEGDHVAYDYASLLPRPNLWERLRSVGVEPITVQPADFAGSPLSRGLYRGARFEGAWDTADLADASVALAAVPGRLVFTYVPHIDFAGHVHGQGGDEFGEAMGIAAGVWEEIARRLPPGAALVGTADHGLMEVSDSDKILVRDPEFDDMRFAGDARGVHVWGDDAAVSGLADLTGADIVDPSTLLGPNPTEQALAHLPERMLLAPPGKVILPRGFDKRLACYHGGISAEEVEVPLLVG